MWHRLPAGENGRLGHTLDSVRRALNNVILGYNTNGFAHHRLADALAILADIGYRSVAITLECDTLDPPDARGVSGAVQAIAPLLKQHDLRCTIETGARFILDARRKHQPTLISASPEDRGRRLRFLKAAIDVAGALGADSVSLWSGTAIDDAGPQEHMHKLVDGVSALCAHAQSRNVRLAFEPEPGMLIATMADFAKLSTAVDHPLLGLTLDVGHVHCLQDGSLRDHVRRWRDRLWNIHIEDMRKGVHEHLMFGDGEIDFDGVFAALRSIDYAGPVHVELSRHSHNAVETARRAFGFLEAIHGTMIPRQSDSGESESHGEQ